MWIIVAWFGFLAALAFAENDSKSITLFVVGAVTLVLYMTFRDD